MRSGSLDFNLDFRAHVLTNIIERYRKCMLHHQNQELLKWALSTHLHEPITAPPCTWPQWPHTGHRDNIQHGRSWGAPLRESDLARVMWTKHAYTRSVVRLHHKATQLNYSATCKHTANCRIIKARRPEKWDGGRWRKSSDISSARQLVHMHWNHQPIKERAQHKGQQMRRPLTQFIFPNPAPILGIK